MRTLFLSHTGVLGGAELSLLDHAKYHPGCKVLLFASGPFYDNLREAKVAVEVLHTSSEFTQITRDSSNVSLGAVWNLLKLARQVANISQDYDVIFANSQKSFVVAALAGRISGRPVVWCLRDILSEEHFSSVNRRFVTVLANSSAVMVIANSQATRDAFVLSGGRASLVRVVHNGIDVRQFSGGANTAIRNELGIGNAPLVGIFSRLSPWKGQSILIKALAKVPEAHALLVGGALFGEHAYEASLHEQVKQLGLEHRVHFLGFRDDVAELMLTADIIVHASTAPEPFGRVVVEGMLAEKPVIAARAGGVAEILTDQSTGLLVEPGDVDELAEAIRELQDSPEKAAALGHSARRHAEENFSLRAMQQGVLECLLEALSGGLERCFTELGVSAAPTVGAPEDALDDYEPQLA